MAAIPSADRLACTNNPEQMARVVANPSIAPPLSVLRMVTRVSAPGATVSSEIVVKNAHQGKSGAKMLNINVSIRVNLDCYKAKYCTSWQLGLALLYILKSITDRSRYVDH